MDPDASGADNTTRLMLHYAPWSEDSMSLGSWKHHAVWVGRAELVQQLVSQGDMQQLYARGEIGVVLAEHPSGRSVRIASTLACNNDDVRGGIQHDAPISIVQLRDVHEYVFNYEALRCGFRALKGGMDTEPSTESNAASAEDNAAAGPAVRVWLGIGPEISASNLPVLVSEEQIRAACEALGGVRLHKEQHLALSAIRKTVSVLE